MHRLVEMRRHRLPEMHRHRLKNLKNKGIGIQILPVPYQNVQKTPGAAQISAGAGLKLTETSLCRTETRRC